MSTSLVLVLYVPYLIFRFFVHFLRNVFWRISGTHRAIVKSQEDYATSAHVLTIVGKFRFEPVLTSNKLLDFLMIHKSFEHPSYVLKDEVTLYHINDKVAVFVECKKGDSPWNMEDYCFSKTGQFRKARKVIIIPIDFACQLADEIGTPKADLIFIHNISRCGSTLMCQIFQETGQYVSYAEPSILNDLMPLAGHHGHPWIAQRMTMVISLLCKESRTNNNIRGHVIKTTPTTSEVLTSLYDLFPHARYMFMYRDCIPTIRSTYRSFMTFSGIFIILILLVTLPDLADLLLACYGQARFRGRIISYKSKGLYAGLSAPLLLAHIMYQKWINENKPFVAVKYEDLKDDPKDSLERIFDFCGTPKDLLPMALRAMEQDSQRTSDLSKSTKVRKAPEFTKDDIQELKLLCMRYLLPDLIETKVLRNTITKSGYV